MTPVQNDFSQGSVARNILSIAVPMTVAQVVNILYSLVDRMYIGHVPGVGHTSLTGMGLTLPLISIVLAFANLGGMGGSPLCSIYRGKGEEGLASAVMGNTLSLLLFFGFAIPLVTIPFLDPILVAFGASDATLPYAKDYSFIYLLGTPFVTVGLGMNPFINSQGFGNKGMLTVMLGAVVNLVLDPILIYGLNLGVKGAAIATIIAQACSAVWVLSFLTGKKSLLPLHLCHLRPRWNHLRRIITLGLSGFFTSITNSLVQIVCNKVLHIYGGDLYVGVMTIINSLREVTFMLIQGFSSGVQPVLGYNYGAGEKRRVCACIRFAVGVTVGYAALIWLLNMTIPGLLIRIFNNNPDMLQAGVPALRVYFSMFVFMALMISSQSIFVGLGQAKKSIFFSILRKAVINAPLTVLLAFFWGVNGVFVAEAVSQFVCGFLCFFTMYRTVYRPLSHGHNFAGAV
ncbi:MATE family efflux transporter [Pseudoflavonifractor sp. An187]|uniref:MATE family efflux transporter n=1 Tax=Pseudoflavonifractor sp. An187 TaxID=1965578 RepID=UPI001FA839F4|nr:MATE family efflux transporter [Pseudoflavonifractor sp. An187]